jgi:hypothetical protein
VRHRGGRDGGEPRADRWVRSHDVSWQKTCCAVDVGIGRSLTHRTEVRASRSSAGSRHFRRGPPAGEATACRGLGRWALTDPRSPARSTGATATKGVERLDRGVVRNTCTQYDAAGHHRTAARCPGREQVRTGPVRRTVSAFGFYDQCQDSDAPRPEGGRRHATALADSNGDEPRHRGRRAYAHLGVGVSVSCSRR